MHYRVAFAPEAQDQLTELYHYIAHANAPVVAQRYVDAIITYCESLSTSRSGARRAMTSARVCALRITKSAPSLPLQSKKRRLPY